MFDRKSLLPVNLSFFGEDTLSPGANGAQDESPAGEELKSMDNSKEDNADNGAKFTQEDVNKVVADRLARERVKLQKEFDSKLEASVQEARSEADKLAKMNSEQKALYEKEKTEASLKVKEQELQARAAEIARKEMDMQVKDILSEKGFPPYLSALIQADDAEQANEKISAMEEYLKKALAEMLNAATRGKGIVPMAQGKEEDAFLAGFNKKR